VTNQKSNKNKGEGLWVPNAILNLPGLNAGEKMLLIRRYGD
jgi:hypothetical protein